MTMDSTATEDSEEGQQSTVLAVQISEKLRIALLRLNYLHRQMQTVRYQFFITGPEQDAIRQEYDAIKERIEQQMEGFSAWYSNESGTHVLVPQKNMGDV